MIEEKRDRMATAEQLKALIKSYAEGDDERFLSVALQVAAHAARSGHSQLARDLRDVIDAAKTGSRTSAQGEDRGQKPVPVVQPRGELAGILSASYPRTRLRDMVLEERLSAKLKRVLLEQLQQERLLSWPSCWASGMLRERGGVIRAQNRGDDIVTC